MNSFVKPCNKQKDGAYSYYSFWILDYSYFDFTIGKGDFSKSMKISFD